MGQMTVGFPVSPLTPSTFLLVGLTGVELGAHQRFSDPAAVGDVDRDGDRRSCSGSDLAMSARTHRARRAHSARARATRATASSRRSSSPSVAEIDYLVFECLAERTIALAQQERQRDPARGYDPFLEARMRAVLPACRRARHPDRHQRGRGQPASRRRRWCASSRATLGLSGLRVAAVAGRRRARSRCATARCRTRDGRRRVAPAERRALGERLPRRGADRRGARGRGGRRDHRARRGLVALPRAAGARARLAARRLDAPCARARSRAICSSARAR